MTPEEAKAKLAQLDACAAEGARRYSEALAASRRAWETGVEVAAPLAAYHAAVLHRQRDADENEAHRLTIELGERIEAEGLLLEPLDPKVPAAGLRVVDPRPARALRDAHESAEAARAERDAFAAQARELLREADDREKMTRVREALDGEDPGALRAAMAELQPEGPGPLTTPDLPAGALR